MSEAKKDLRDRLRQAARRPALSETPQADPGVIHHQARGQTLMPWCPHCRQRDIWAYQPAPNSSKPSCRVSSRQSGQKRRNRSGTSQRRISLRQARCDSADQTPSAASIRCQRLRRMPPARPPRWCVESKPTRPRILRRVKGRAERAIIASSYEAPTPVRQVCRCIKHASRKCAAHLRRNSVGDARSGNCSGGRHGKPG
jgi:hypothetical protein